MTEPRQPVGCRKPGPRPVTCATMTASARIFGQDQIDTFRTMYALAGRRPHELAADVVLEAILQARHDHEVQHLTVRLPGGEGR